MDRMVRRICCQMKIMMITKLKSKLNLMEGMRSIISIIKVVISASRME